MFFAALDIKKKKLTIFYTHKHTHETVKQIKTEQN